MPKNLYKNANSVIEGNYDNTSLGSNTYLLGLTSLFDEMGSQGHSIPEVLSGTNISPDAMNQSSLYISQVQKIQLFQNIQKLSHDPLIGLRAGQKQRLSDFGVYGYALYSSRNFRQAVELGIRHIKLAGPILKKSFYIRDDVAIFEGQDIIALGKLLPLVCEFWFSSMQTLIERVLEGPFQAKKLLLPYPASDYAEEYEKVFHCPVQFNAGVMQWHFDLKWLDVPCPNANPITADMCKSFCERMLGAAELEEPELVKTIRLILLDGTGLFPSAQEMAERLHISKRTLHRRLAGFDLTYQELLDETRRRLADEYLRETTLTVDEIAERIGFSDTSNFRKAYRHWTGISPNEYRIQYLN
ncbi:AraC family transcriptional regulator [Acinetobacter sp. 826659]|uniref:AraC family transcriptional regulator n=1 Tax=Acinetobacter sp. 826659 TaxID=1310764 RepID=UPI000450C2EA|nr:AraC family transcriptional regulator [Acinetobacter sp. 826659]EXS31757.1 bacterial regulatory helix-turn-helix s, AraC family protein [Acinetobacter sp. 826659]